MRTGKNLIWTDTSPAVALPRYIYIGDQRYLWRDLVALRRAQARPSSPQPTLFELRDDHRPAGERNAAERYLEPSLFAANESPDWVVS